MAASLYTVESGAASHSPQARTTTASTCALLNVHLEQLVEFLELGESVRLLSTCRSLRFDDKLAAHIRRLTPCIQHLHYGCADDWCSLTPSTSFFRNSRIGWEFCKSDGHTEDQQDKSGGSDVQLLSMAALVQCRLAQWCYSPVTLMRSVDDLVVGHRYNDTRYVCRPLLVSIDGLSSCHPSEWTQGGIANALNKVCPGLGSGFLDRHDPRRVDDLLGLHWDGIQVDSDATDSASTATRCALCDWREHVLQLYSSQHPELLSFPTDDRHRRQAEEDAILRLMLSEGVALPDHLEQLAFDGDELRRMVYCALSWYDRRQCETFYRPLKQVLQRSLRSVRLADVTWGAPPTSYGSRPIAQLVAGVSPTGYLVGIYRLAVGRSMASH